MIFCKKRSIAMLYFTKSIDYEVIVFSIVRIERGYHL